ncbi:hypothetical protein AND_000779 [Anopheles darlingi]|uniref:Uncharacterized protein n=1 Tax=Anopheles darlingi TaxID=43151 RepID=W5JW84_ANODA|nr:hypothetical protein AND_000779 [Anopheles darlingi]
MEESYGPEEMQQEQQEGRAGHDRGTHAEGDLRHSPARSPAEQPKPERRPRPQTTEGAAEKGAGSKIESYK